MGVHRRHRHHVARRLAGSFALAVIVFAIAALSGPAGPVDVSAAGTVRGIYRFSSTTWGTMAGLGFNAVTDGGTNTNNYAGQRAAGLRGMVWLDAYSNTTCKQTMTDAQIQSIVHTNASGGNAGATYQVGDEPTTNGCAAASTYSHITSVIHAADGSAKSWVADDQFNDPSISHWPAGLPMKGSVDYLAFDIYPCQSGPCELAMIDQAVQRIHSVGLRNWMFIIQDFGPCQSWRAPNATEVLQQFQHWQKAGAIGYWVYTYDTDPTPCPGNVAGTGVLRQINSMPLNPTTPPPSPKPTPKPAASPTPAVHSPSPSPSAGHSPSTSPSKAPSGVSPSASASPQPSDTAQHVQNGGPGLLPLILVALGILVVLAAILLTRLRRRT